MECFSGRFANRIHAKMIKRDNKFYVYPETGDVKISTTHGSFLIDERERDWLQCQLQYARQDEGADDLILETKEALKSKLALYELNNDQKYWREKWQATNRKAMNEYINFHTADKARDAAIKSNLELDDLLLLE